ncbi:MAG: hypothetical protein K2G36_03850 [Ruminococcus sp.]|nr:hypothetical protein [Ruminococcus sp.]
MKNFRKMIAYLSALSICVSMGSFTDATIRNVSAVEDYSVSVTADDNFAEYSKQALELINKERTKQGLPAFTTNSALNSSASVRANEIIESFSVKRPDGSDSYTVLIENSISVTKFSENISMGYSEETPAEDAVAEWMDSEGHRANILNKDYTSTGIGVAEQDGAYYWVQIFADDVEVSNDVNWSVDKDGTLTVNGTGDMPEQLSLFSLSDSVKKAVIGKDIKSVNCYSLAMCNNLEEIIINNPSAEIKNAEYEVSAKKVYGYEGSPAQKYAKNTKKTFISLGEGDSTVTTTTTNTTKGSDTKPTTTTTTTTKPVGNNANNGFTDKEISASKYKPVISVDKVVLSYEEALEICKNGGTVPVNITVSGADKAYSSTAFHLNNYPSEYDTKLIIDTSTNKIDMSIGKAIEKLAYSIKMDYDSNLFLSTSGNGNDGKDGIMYTVNFKLPVSSDIKGGETFPINIEYMGIEDEADCFTNKANDKNGQLMQAWLFTQGIENGYIKIEKPSENTTQKPSTSGVAGDANGDGNISLADAVLIMQSIANPNEEKYKLSEEAMELADVVDKGSGLTPMDALAIQMINVELLTPDDLPTTSEILNSLT